MGAILCTETVTGLIGTGGGCSNVEWISPFQMGMFSSNWLNGKRVYSIKDLESSPWKSGCIPFKKPESHKASLVAQLVKNLPAMQENQVWLLGWEDPLEKEMATHFSILRWRIPMDRGAWRATVHAVARVGHDLVTKSPPVIYNKSWRLGYSLAQWNENFWDGNFLFLRFLCNLQLIWEPTVAESAFQTVACIRIAQKAS